MLTELAAVFAGQDSVHRLGTWIGTPFVITLLYETFLS